MFTRNYRFSRLHRINAFMYSKFNSICNIYFRLVTFDWLSLVRSRKFLCFNHILRCDWWFTSYEWNANNSVRAHSNTTHWQAHRACCFLFLAYANQEANCRDDHLCGSGKENEIVFVWERIFFRTFCYSIVFFFYVCGVLHVWCFVFVFCSIMYACISSKDFFFSRYSTQSQFHNISI